MSPLSFEQRLFQWRDEAVVAKVEDGRIYAAVCYPHLGHGEPLRWLSAEVQPPSRRRKSPPPTATSTAP